MESGESSGRAQPFQALIAASSLIAALLYVAGFAFRWSYYYNFGVQHLVFNLSFQSMLTASMEMIKQPKNLAITAAVLAGVLLLVNAFLSGVRRVSSWQGRGRAASLVAATARALGAESPLINDALRAAVVFYVVYMLASQMGYMQFRKHIVNTRENSLPVVTAIVQGSEDFALACGKEWKVLPNLVGDAKRAQYIRDYHRTCTLDTTVWRLLYRDDKSIYLFASEAQQSGKPLTLVLPNTDKTVLVLE